MNDRWEIAQKIIVAFAVLCVTFLIPVLVQLYFFNSRNQKTADESASEQLSLFRIDSLPPQSVIPGSEFTYQVVWKYNGKENVALLVDEKPEWLSWDNTNHTFKGLVPEETSFFKIKVTAKAGALVDIQEASIEVKKPEELNSLTPTALIPTTLSSTPTSTITATPTASPTEMTEQTPTAQIVAGIINPEDPFHPYVQSTPTEILAEATESASVLGVSTVRFPEENSQQSNYIPLIAGIVIVITLVLAGALFFLPKNKIAKDTYKTQSGLIIHSSHGKDS